jgi:hypothetical protein
MQSITINTHFAEVLQNLARRTVHDAPPTNRERALNDGPSPRLSTPLTFSTSSANSRRRDALPIPADDRTSARLDCRLSWTTTPLQLQTRKRTTTHRTRSAPPPQRVRYAHTSENGHQKRYSPIPAPLSLVDRTLGSARQGEKTL